MDRTQFLIAKAEELNYPIRSMDDLVSLQELVGFVPLPDLNMVEPTESVPTLQDIYNLISENHRSLATGLERNTSTEQFKMISDLHKVHFPTILPKSEEDHKQDFIAKILSGPLKRIK